MIPIVVGGIGMVPKDLEMRLRELEEESSIQTAALLKPAEISYIIIKG